jgi:hypothetical protein
MEEADVGHCVNLGERFHQTSNWGWIPFSKEKTEEYILWSIREPNRLALVAEDVSKELYGFFFARASRIFFSENHNSSAEEFMWVSPEKRGGVTAIRFMKAWEAWCKDMNVCQMHFDPNSHGQGERWDSFMSRLGYTQEGRCYRKVI